MFTKLDSVTGKPTDPRSMNRFLYAEGNPWTMVDPSGHGSYYEGEGCGPGGIYCGSTGTQQKANTNALTVAKTGNPHAHDSQNSGPAPQGTPSLGTPQTAYNPCPGPTCGAQVMPSTETSSGSSSGIGKVLVDATGFRYGSAAGVPAICIGADDVRRCTQLRSGGDDVTWTTIVVAGVVVSVVLIGFVLAAPVEVSGAVVTGTGAAAAGGGAMVYAAEDEIAASSGDQIVLGFEEYGLRDTARALGGRDLMGDPNWMDTVERGAQDPTTKFTVSLDGMRGTDTYDQITQAAELGTTNSPEDGFLNWEIGQLQLYGRLPDVTFVRNGIVVPNPFAGALP